MKRYTRPVAIQSEEFFEATKARIWVVTLLLMTTYLYGYIQRGKGDIITVESVPSLALAELAMGGSLYVISYCAFRPKGMFLESARPCRASYASIARLAYKPSMVARI